MIYRRLIRPLLFRLDPERAHHVALGALRLCGAVPPLRALLGALYGRRHAGGERELWGLRFPSPVGLAAGFDKNARALPALERLGFGFLEVGAISAAARPGNPRPRIFRLAADRGLINRMGLPNDGAAAIAARLAAHKDRRVPVFANIVKTADLEGTVAEMAADYVATLRAVLPHVDGFTVNISCPASPDLKAFNRGEAMFELLEALRSERGAGSAAAGGRFRPLLLKVSPDIDDEERRVIVDACGRDLLDGLVLTNTTTRRPDTLAAAAAVRDQRGGLSGAPLHPIALEVVRWFREATGGRVPIIGVGGIATVDQARAMLEAGASLIEVYTGFVYEGPSLPSLLAAALS